MTDTQIEQHFDWSTHGETFWRDLAATQSRISEQQIRIACALDRGCSQAEAARQAGYSGQHMRQNGYKAATSSAVRNVLAIAAAEKSADEAAKLNEAEAIKILAKLARSGDPN